MFRLDFKNTYSLFTYWGEILSKLAAGNDFNQFGEDATLRGILANRENERKERVYQFAIRLNAIDGTFEEHPFKSYQSLKGIFRQTNEILSLINVQEYTRVGVRFIFLGPQGDFGEICDRVSANLSRQYLELFDRRASDVSIITVHTEGNEKMRLGVGPINKAEYQQWFVSPTDIEQKSTVVFDVDCFAAPFKSAKFDLEKLVSLYYSKSLEHVERIGRLVSPEIQK